MMIPAVYFQARLAGLFGVFSPFSLTYVKRPRLTVLRRYTARLPRGLLVPELPLTPGSEHKGMGCLNCLGQGPGLGWPGLSRGKLHVHMLVLMSPSLVRSRGDNR